MSYNFVISEEIIRWTLEVFIEIEQGDWWIAFRNPTAGPWKTVTAPDAEGISQEVYRFTRDEDRPDLILVNDTVKRTLVVEAKDSFQKIGNRDQLEKSLRAVATIKDVLARSSASVWKDRKYYSFYPAFLWHSATFESAVSEHMQILRLCQQLEASFPWLSGSITINTAIVDEGGALRPIFFREGKHSRSLDFLSR